MKTYTTYWVDYSVRGLQGSIRSEEIVACIIFFGVRLQDVFLSQERFAAKLGFVDRQAILDKLVEKEKPTFLKLNTQSNAARMGLIRELSIQIVPKYKESEIFPYLDRYKTTLPYNAGLNIRDVVDTIYKAEFTLGEGENTAIYVVDPGSLKEKKAKRTTPTYS